MLSKRSQVDPFLVMQIMSEANARETAGQSIIHMEVGQPGTPAPKLARDAVKEQLNDPLGYSLALGRDDLRNGIAVKYKRELGLNIDPSRIVITTGSSAAFQLAFIALFDARARVGIAEPGYPSYRNILKALSLEPVGIVTHAESGFQPIIGDIDAEKMDGILVASPANPTGTVIAHDELKTLIKKAAAQNIPLISDEIYHGLTYGKRATSALEISDDVIVINSFSKYYSMTGWRLGWMVVPEYMVQTFERLAQNMFICPPHISQVAGIAALDAGEECQENLAIYAQNRDVIAKGLTNMGMTKFGPPDGGFYFYVDVSEYCDDSRDLAREWLDYGVSATPGWDFDPIRGGQFIRLSYARSHADITEGMLRIKKWADKRSK